MLEADSIRLRCGNFSLEQVSFRAADASCHVIAGPSGCGKTMLLETLLGLRVPDTGTIRLNGRDVTGLPPEKRGISYVPQDLALFPHLTVEENIFYARALRRTPPEALDLIRDLAGAMGVTPLFSRFPDALSGGERQRIALLRSLGSGNRVLLLDEPFSALHEGSKLEAWKIIGRLCRELCLTIVLVTHDLREMTFLADSLTVMWNGRAVATGKPSDILTRPQTTSIARFVGLGNLWPARIRYINAEGSADVSIEALGLDMTVPRNKQTAGLGPVHIGIWPSSVRLLATAEAAGNGFYEVPAFIERIYGLFNQYLLVCKTSTGGRIEACVSRDKYAGRCHGEGSPVRLALCGEHCFIVAQDGPPPSVHGARNNRTLRSLAGRVYRRVCGAPHRI